MEERAVFSSNGSHSVCVGLFSDWDCWFNFSAPFLPFKTQLGLFHTISFPSFQSSFSPISNRSPNHLMVLSLISLFPSPLLHLSVCLLNQFHSYLNSSPSILSSCFPHNWIIQHARIMLIHAQWHEALNPSLLRLCRLPSGARCLHGVFSIMHLHIISFFSVSLPSEHCSYDCMYTHKYIYCPNHLWNWSITAVTPVVSLAGETTEEHWFCSSHNPASLHWSPVSILHLYIRLYPLWWM